MGKYYDTSDLDREFYVWALPRLKAFKTQMRKITANYKTEDGMWYTVIDKMIKGVELAIKDPYKPKEMKQCSEGLLLFGKYLRHLWW